MPLAVIVEILKLALPLLVTVTGKLSVWPSTTSPKRRIVGLKVNGVDAEAGLFNATMDSRALNKKKMYFATGRGRVIAFSVCRWVCDQ